MINKGREYLEGRFGTRFWAVFPKSERLVQAGAWLIDVIKLKEKTGRNDGAEVEAILANIGLGPGYPWCAAFAAIVCDIAAVPRPTSRAGAVLGWWMWAKLKGKTIGIGNVKRGDFVLASYGGGKGHMGLCYRKVGPVIWTFEGNTSPGSKGSQRDGQGGHRRMRLARFWDLGAVRL